MSTIFLAEDDQYLRRVYERAFRFAGHTVTVAEDGEKALEALTAATDIPSVVVMDIQMPKLDGFGLLTAVRKDPRYAAVPVVMLTNSFTQHDEERFFSAGADAYLVKIENQSKQVVTKIEQLIQTGRVKKT